MKRNGVFISYSHKDKRWLEHLKVHLNFLERNHQFEIWNDTKIKPGTLWKDEIANAMSSAKVALLLISPHFMNSAFIQEEELPPLLVAAEKEGALIFPLIVSHCMFSEFPSLSRFQAVNPVSKPLVEMDTGERDALFLKVTKDIKNALTAIEKQVTSVAETKPNNKPKTAFEELRLTMTKTCVVIALANEWQRELGLSITEVVNITRVKNRKNVVESLRALEDSGLVKKVGISKHAYWKLTMEGKKLAEEFAESIIKA